MTITYTIDQRSVEGNKRVNYGRFTMTSSETDTRTVSGVHPSLRTGLRVVEKLECWSQTRASPTSGVAEPRCTYPTSWPALDASMALTSGEKYITSGHFTIEFTSTAGPIFWEAKGKV